MMEKQIKFIFWNVHRNKDNISKLLDYSWNNNIDVVIICEEPDAWDRECVLDHYRIVKRIVPDTAAGIEVFIRNDNPAPPHYFRENRRHATLCLKDWNINLVVAHLNSNMTPNAKDIRTLDIQSMVNDLDRIEEISGSKHSLIVGDLNIGLFDEQMSSIIGLNARLHRYQMQRPTVTVHECTRDLFYNPMIKVYQDTENPNMPKGTHFYRGKPEQWFCYDHVLMKKPLMPRFDSDRFQVLACLGTERLVSDNVMRIDISDHLPLYFEIRNNGDVKNE